MGNLVWHHRTPCVERVGVQRILDEGRSDLERLNDYRDFPMSLLSLVLDRMLPHRFFRPVLLK